MNISIQMPESILIDENSSNDFGVFTLQPLEIGYGATIGNSFRRILISSIPGNAIIGVKISNILSEFETIPGVIEDTAEVILNLKSIRLSPSDKKLTKVVIKAHGAGTITGADLEKATPGLEVLNPEQIICNLAEDADLEIELRIGRGKGYVPAEEQPTTDFPINMLPIDAIFSPIKNVVYKVEPFRVGQRTDYEKLVLEVSTDSSISPKEAVHHASKILHEHVKLFLNIFEMEVEEIPQPTIEDEQKIAELTKIRKIILTPVEELELSVRAHNCLKAADIKTLGELVRLQESELLKFRNFGKKSLTELGDVVVNFGLEFGMNVDKFLEDTKHLA
jgi:DNA-directed RNA polymerase subunit alpha